MRAAIVKQPAPVVSVCGAAQVAIEASGKAVSESAIRDAADTGDLPSMRTNTGQRLFQADDVRRWAIERAERRAR